MEAIGEDMDTRRKNNTNANTNDDGRMKIKRYVY